MGGGGGGLYGTAWGVFRHHSVFLRRNARLLLHHHTQIMGRHAELRSIKLDLVLRLGIIVDQPDETLDGLSVTRLVHPSYRNLRLIQGMSEMKRRQKKF